MPAPPSDARAARFPISVKGVVLVDDEVLLLENARGEWELPGGKLESGESPESAVTREIREELDLEVRAVLLLDTWVYPVAGVEVVILTYGCRVFRGTPRRSNEHVALGRFRYTEVAGLPMPAGYARSIAAWGRREREVVYKVLPQAQWMAAVAQGAFAGSPDDRRDGFIHLSTAGQVAGTLAKHFAGCTDLVLVAVDTRRLDGAQLRWEPSRGGARFPHLYGPLPTHACDAVYVLDGRPLPAGL